MTWNNNLSTYVQRISSVRYFLQFKKNTYIRLRINYSWTNGGHARGDKSLTELLRDYTQDKDLSCFSIFVQGFWNEKVEEFFKKYNAKVLVTHNRNIAGIQFDNAKYKEVFLLRYSEYFPDASLIK
jgi:hypothetical protein